MLAGTRTDGSIQVHKSAQNERNENAGLINYSVKNTIRRGVHRLEFDVIRLKQSPKRTLLGLAGDHIASTIDVGANKGQFARMISDFFPRAILYCFEPLAEPYRELSALAQLKIGCGHCLKFARGEEGRKLKCIYTSDTRLHPRCLRLRRHTLKPRRIA